MIHMEGYWRPTDTEPHHAVVVSPRGVSPRFLSGESETTAWHGVERFAIPAVEYSVNLDLAPWRNGCNPQLNPESVWPHGGLVAKILLDIDHGAFRFTAGDGRIVAMVQEEQEHPYLVIAERPAEYFRKSPSLRTGDPFFAAHLQKKRYADGFALLHFVDATGAVVSSMPEHAANRSELNVVVLDLADRLDSIRGEMGE